jgi:hypothetical protein
VPAGTVTVAEPAPLTTTCAAMVIVWPATVAVITSVSVRGCPDASTAALGQTTLPDLTLTAVLPSWVSGSEIEPSEWRMRVTAEGVVAAPTRLSLLLIVTRSPPAMGATAVIRLVTVPFSAALSVSSYTQVFPTVAGNMDEAVPRPLPDVPELDDVLAVAFPDVAELEVVPELEPELELALATQPVSANPTAAITAAKTAVLRDVRVVKLDRFISLPRLELVVGVVAGPMDGVARGW